jgi:uncharacterized protein with HEPN domain
MNKHKSSPLVNQLWLQDIAEMCADLREFSAHSLERRETVFACLHCLTVIGEAANRISPEIQQRYPEIPWKQIIGTRHRIVHDYHKVDTVLLQEILQHHIPRLHHQILHILDEMESG